MPDHKVVSGEEWQAARDELLPREKEHTRTGDELARERRDLPWVAVEKEYRFDTDEGTRALGELFDGCSLLVFYHFMFGPSYESGCPVNSSMADAFDGLVPHLRARDVTLALVSQAPLPKLQAYKQRMGWRLPWVSSANTDFNFDYGAAPIPRRRCANGPSMSASCLRSLRQNATATGTDVADTSRSHGGERVHAPRRRRLSDLHLHMPRARVPEGLLPGPRPRTERPRRGRGHPAVDSPPRRVRLSPEFGPVDSQHEVLRGQHREGDGALRGTSRSSASGTPTHGCRSAGAARTHRRRRRTPRVLGTPTRRGRPARATNS